MVDLSSAVQLHRREGNVLVRTAKPLMLTRLLSIFGITRPFSNLGNQNEMPTFIKSTRGQPNW